MAGILILLLFCIQKINYLCPVTLRDLKFFINHSYRRLTRLPVTECNIHELLIIMLYKLEGSTVFLRTGYLSNLVLLNTHVGILKGCGGLLHICLNLLNAFRRQLALHFLRDIYRFIFDIQVYSLGS